MIQLFSMNAIGDEKARKIFKLFGIPYEEIHDSIVTSGLTPYRAPVIREDDGTLSYGDDFFLNNVILFSLGETCPNCCILHDLLLKAGIPFKEITDISEIKKYGYTHLPTLTVYGGFPYETPIVEFGYKEAFKRIKNYISENEAIHA